MGNGKAPKNVTSNIAAAANPAAFSNTHIANDSAILKSSFAPFRFGVPLFASVVQGFDAQHLRIHDITTGRILSEHKTSARATITCLDWGYYGGSSANSQDQESTKKKKRKRSHQPNGPSSSQDIVLAFGTSASEVQLYAPAESKILRVLKDDHSKGIRDFKFVNDGRESKAYSAGGDGRLVQWDLKQGTALVSIMLTSNPPNTIHPVGSQVICASHLSYIVKPGFKVSSTLYNSSTNTVHTIVDDLNRSEDQGHFMTIAEIDHCINVFKEEATTLIGSLRTDNEILAADFWSMHVSGNGPQDNASSLAQPEQVLAALNKDGAVEVFPEPFKFKTSSSGKNAESLKARMKQRSRRSVAQVKIVRPDKGAAQVPLIGVCFQDDRIAFAWVEGGLNVIFDTVKWRDEETGNLLLSGSVEIVKKKSSAGLGAISTNGVKNMGKSQVDDSHAVVANGMDADDVSMEEVDTEVIDISSAEEESEFEEDEPVAMRSTFQEDVDDDEKSDQGEEGAENNDENMEDAEVQDEHQESEAESPSFGDLIRANASDPIDVPHNLVDDHPQSLVPANPTSVRTLSSGLSLGTVLTQSLRTNDVNLLETCFHTQDLSTVRATIERLDSSFAIVLLQRLAERLHSRPGRAGSLMVWIQWTLVAHGGYLAGQPGMMRKLKSLHKVVKERAGSLQSLLSLKGKLDMLEAQMNLRQSMFEKSRGADTEEEDDEDAVIYVEGQEEDDSADDDEELDDDDEDDNDDERAKVLGPGAVRAKAMKNTNAAHNHAEDNDEEEDDEEEEAIQTTTNGTFPNAEEDEDASDSEADSDNNDNALSDSDSNNSDEDLNSNIDHNSIDIDIDAESSDGGHGQGQGQGRGDSPPPPPPAAKRSKKRGLSNGIGPRGH